MATEPVRARRFVVGGGKSRRTWRIRLAWLAAVGLVVALAVPAGVALAGPKPPPPPPPAPVTSDASGLTVVVRSVQAAGKRIVLTFDAINGSQGPLFVADHGDPVVLAGTGGQAWRSVDNPVRLDRLTTTSLKVDLAGASVPASGSLTLELNKQAGSEDHPAVTVNAVAVSGGRTTTFSSPSARGVPLHATVGYNVDGLSVVVRRVDVQAGLVEVSVLAVNGNPDEVKLIGDPQDGPFLQDDTGRKSTLVPAPDDATLSIPGRQRLSGVLRFAGGISTDATRLSLHFNDRFGTSDDPHGTTPRVDIAGLDVGSVSGGTGP